MRYYQLFIIMIAGGIVANHIEFSPYLVIAPTFLLAAALNLFLFDIQFLKAVRHSDHHKLLEVCEIVMQHNQRAPFCRSVRDAILGDDFHTSIFIAAVIVIVALGCVSIAVGHIVRYDFVSHAVDYILLIFVMICIESLSFKNNVRDIIGLCKNIIENNQ